jgi:hypothetical protein
VWNRVRDATKPFGGDMQAGAITAEFWLAEMEERARIGLRAGCLTEEDQLQLVEAASARLEGAALSWWRRQRMGPWKRGFPIWEVFSAALLNMFPPPTRISAIPLFKGLQQGWDSVDQYCDRALDCDARVPDDTIPQLVKTTEFMSGLNSQRLYDMADDELMRVGDNMRLEAMVEFVRHKHHHKREVEALRRGGSSGGGGSSSGGGGSSSGGHGGGWRSRGGGGSSGSGGGGSRRVNAIQGQVPGSSEYTGCLACGSMDHVVRECTEEEAVAKWRAAQRERKLRKQRRQEQGEGRRPSGGGASA